MPQPLLWDLQITDGLPKLFREYLADFNILAIQRVPVPSHGPSTNLPLRLLAENRSDKDVTICGFDIRSPGQPCETCQQPHIVYTGLDLATIGDNDGSILRQFGVVGYDRFFVVRSVPQVSDAGSIEQISRSDLHPCRNALQDVLPFATSQFATSWSNGVSARISARPPPAYSAACSGVLEDIPHHILRTTPL